MRKEWFNALCEWVFQRYPQRSEWFNALSSGPFIVMHTPPHICHGLMEVGKEKDHGLSVWLIASPLSGSLRRGHGWLMASPLHATVALGLSLSVQGNGSWPLLFVPRWRNSSWSLLFGATVVFLPLYGPTKS